MFLLNELVVVFALSIFVIIACHRLRLPTIVGFLITGVLAGPTAFGLVSAVHEVELLAEIGVVLLLFSIGMELSGEELARLRKLVFVGGTIQTCLTVVGVAVFFALFGLAFPQGVFFGCLAALSSTAIVLRLLQQKAQAEAPHGRIALAVLIFQDLAIVPMVLAVPLLAGSAELSPVTMAKQILRAVAVLGGFVLFARYALPHIMRSVVRTRSRELLLLSTLALCLAVALTTLQLGLSLSLGAFLAGLLLAGSEYSLNALEGVIPFRDVFTSLFFISVGMLLDLNFLASHLPLVLLVALGILGAKVLFSLPATLALGYPLRIAIMVSFALAQVGEFSFVLARAGMDHNLLTKSAYQTFLAASILTMIATPAMMALSAPASALAGRLAWRRTPRPLPVPHGTACDASAVLDETLENTPHPTPACLADHLVIVGFGLGGKHLAQAAKQAGINYVIIEMNPDTVARYRATEPILHGDASYPLVLEHIGIRQARVLAIVISDPAAVRATTAAARALNPHLHVVARTRFVGEVGPLMELGAQDIIPEEFETSIEVFNRVLGHYLVPRHVIDAFTQSIRAANYDMLRRQDTRGTDILTLGNHLAGVEVISITVAADSPLCGQTLEEAALGRDHGISVVALQRDEALFSPPEAATMFHAADVAFLLGTPEKLRRVAKLFNAVAG